MNTRINAFLAVLYCAAPGAPLAMAGATLTADDRAIDILVDACDQAGRNLVNPAAQAPPFGAAFNLELDSGVVHSPNGASQGEAIVNQISSLDASPSFSQVNAGGSSFTTGEADTFDINDVTGDGDSVFKIQFSVATAQDYTLTGSVVDGPSGSTGRVRLRPIGGADIHIQGTTGSFNFAGSLAPGNYELIGEALVAGFASDSGAGFFSRSASYDLEFNIGSQPCTAGSGDGDADGDVDLDDLAGLVDCLAGPEIIAGPGCDCFDADTDSDIDLQDSAAFQDVFTGPV